MANTFADRPIRLFVVDDHPVMRYGIVSLFDCEPDVEVVGSASSGPEALLAIPPLHIDVVLTDMRMAGMEGDAFVSSLLRVCPQIRSAMLTNYHSDEEVFRAIRAGVRAFILKTAPMDEIIEAVRVVHAGGRWIPEPIAEQLAVRIARIQPSSRELEVLKLIACGVGRREIAAQLHISENTVRNHINNVLEKLDSHDRTKAVTEALRLGLLRLDDVDPSYA
ncbi:MAG TPA: response regulator transcription factor [Terracidiphilus sp.]|nr:response regulator transcription factor [Terracidiphilus sp.]